MKIESVVVAILSWNGRSHLGPCLDALSEQTDPSVDWRVVVFDNGSTDGTAAWLERHHPEIELVRSERNLGFCAGYNRLIEGLDCDAVALLNNDTRPTREWLAALVEALRSAPSDVAAVSGVLLDWSGERLDFASGAMTFDAHAFQLDFGRLLGEVDLPKDGSELLFACGGNMLVGRNDFLEAGGFDERFFAYLEDVDLGWRMWSAGKRVLLAGRAVAHHRSMATSDLLGLYNRGFLFERNAFLCCSKNYDEEVWPRIMPAILLTLISRTQRLLVENNPAGEQLLVDPYDGHIANTKAIVQGAGEKRQREGLLQKWRRHGTVELLVRGAKKAGRSLRPLLPDARETPSSIILSDERSVAQFRALSSILRLLDDNHAERTRVQQRRKRPDREIFERFPLLVVPTYPGDAELFSTLCFDAWIEVGLPLRRAMLEEIMQHG